MRTAEVQHDVVLCELDPFESFILYEASAEAQKQAPDLSEAAQVDLCYEMGRQVGAQLTGFADFMGDMAMHSGPKVVLIPTVDFPPPDVLTPTQYPGEQNDTLYPQDFVRAVVLGVADLYGYGFSAQQAGNIHNDIVPVNEFAAVNGHNSSSSIPLGFHTEVASYNLGDEYDISPDFLSLHFFRNHTLVPTIVAMPDFDELPAEMVDLLKQPWFYNRTSPAQGGESNDPHTPISILYGPDNDPWLRVNTSKLDVTRYSDEKADALLELKRHLEARSLPLDVPAGTLAFIDNRRVVHGRTAYKAHQLPKYDGTDRWQRRITAACDPTRIQAFESKPHVADIDRFINKARLRALLQGEA